MRKRVVCLTIAFLLFLAMPLPAAANSAEPPSFAVLVEDPPEDLAVSLRLESGESESPYRTWKAWEGYFRFFCGDPRELAGARLVVETGTGQFDIPLDPAGFTRYNNLLTLDLDRRTVVYGQPWWRTPLLVSLRLLLTLILEGIVFAFFGYRERRSWKVFLLTNLVTQLGVNLCILYFLGPSPVSNGINWLHGAFLYTPMELLVLAVEMAVFGWYLEEQSKSKARRCAATANLLSWMLGGALLAWLPI